MLFYYSRIKYNEFWYPLAFFFSFFFIILPHAALPMESLKRCFTKKDVMVRIFFSFIVQTYTNTISVLLPNN